MRASAIWLITVICLTSLQAMASHIVLTTGYANSRAPKTPPAANYFDNGIGYSFGARVDIDKTHIWFGPSFFFWNNLTGDPVDNLNSSYYQIELGGRLFYHTQTVPALYAGGGLGYSVSHGEIRDRYDYAGFGETVTFDGEFPTASVIVGIKTPSRTNGIGLMVEGGYHFGLDDPSGRKAIGPARAWTIQLGVLFDTRFAGE